MGPCCCVSSVTKLGLQREEATQGFLHPPSAASPAGGPAAWGVMWGYNSIQAGCDAASTTPVSTSLLVLLREAAQTHPKAGQHHVVDTKPWF